MSKTRYAEIILLLADGFDEASVSVTLTVLRQQGLAVKLIALRSKRVSGAHGLIIVPDNSLDQMLKKHSPILALILPQGVGHLSRLQRDPRVSNLIKQSIAEEALLVSFDDQARQIITDFAEIEGKTINVIQPEVGTSLEGFVNMLTQRLVGIIE